MDEISLCPVCHQSVQPIEYFCHNCGKNLRERPLETKLAKQIFIYGISLFAPPLGIIWGIRYLRQEDDTSHMIGIIAIVLTLVSSVATVWFTIKTFNTINEQVSKQMQTIQGF